MINSGSELKKKVEADLMTHMSQLKQCPVHSAPSFFISVFCDQVDGANINCVISVLELESAIYIVMGANIGTTVTNTIVSLAQSADRYN